MSRCLITGGCGFVGSHVVDLLIEQGHQVVILDDLSTGKMENLNPKAELLVGSITKPSKIGLAIQKLGGVDYIYHLAALARIQPSIENPIASHKVNLNGTLNLLEACRKYKAKIIFSGSSSIYEGSKLPTAETDPIEPKSPYALQKWLSEQYIELYHRLYGTQYTIFRYFNVYGERQILEGAYAAVVGIFLDQKSKGEDLTITNDGEQKRDFTYVKDIASANLMAMNWDNDTYNLGTGTNYSINQIADFVGGKKTYIGERRGEVKETLANNSKATSQLWKPTKDIKDWIYEQTL